MRLNDALPPQPTPDRHLAGLRVLVVHEWLYAWAGAEHCLEQLLAIVPHADVIVGTITDDIRRQQPIARRARETWLGKIPGARTRHRWFLPLHALAFASVDTSEYDLVISISHSFGKLVRCHGHTRHLCYCLTPPRYLWDLEDTYARHSPTTQRIALRMAAAPLRSVDRLGARGVDRFVSISGCTAARVRRAYGRPSDVVYPPVAPKGQTVASPREPFLLCLGRLVPYKRVDLAILAAEHLHMRLVVAGEGPDRRRLESLAGPHTEFLGSISDAEAAQLLATCSAFVFCAEEDFGIAPLEANAHGAPVVSYAFGGASETMIDGRSAILFQRQTAEDVANAVRRCLAHEWDVDEIRANADRFSRERFHRGMIEQMLATIDMPLARSQSPRDR